MTTPCAIFYKNQEEKYQGIFCHYNGMTEHSADILYHHYQDEALVKQLIQLGGIFYLMEDIRETITFRSVLNTKRINAKRIKKKKRMYGWSS